MDSANPPQGCVLIVDDDAAIREALILALEDEGYQVQSANNGRDALDRLRRSPRKPDLILLDLMMPVMSGWDFRREQERDPELAAIPVVVLSADRSLYTRDSPGTESIVNARAYLAKPVDIDTLVAVVSWAVAVQRR